MTNLKTRAEALIDRLADKTLSFGCRLKMGLFDESWFLYKNEENKTWKHCSVFDKGGTNRVYTEEPNKKNENFEYIKKYIIGHPVLIGDVLEAIKILNPTEEITDPNHIDCGKKIFAYWAYQQSLIEFWGPCGLNKSLNEILKNGMKEIKCEMCKGKGYTTEEDFKHNDGYKYHTCHICNGNKKIMQKPKVQALFEFLDKTFPVAQEG